jgi:AcrR family transcriptional regulator
MARRTKEAAAAAREGLLGDAELCFLEQGVSRATLDQIGCAPAIEGRRLLHFKNK